MTTTNEATLEDLRDRRGHVADASRAINDAIDEIDDLSCMERHEDADLEAIESAGTLLRQARAKLSEVRGRINERIMQASAAREGVVTT